MSDLLLPCPFCGSENHMIHPPTCDRNTPYNPHDRAFPMIRCAGCFIDVPGDNFDATCKSAVDRWNRRAPSTLEAELEKAREAALEEAAKVAEAFRDKHWMSHDIKIGIFPKRSEAGVAIAAAIRALSQDKEG